jgi:hypothetical protein
VVVAWAGDSWLVGYARGASGDPETPAELYLREVTPSGAFVGAEVHATTELDGLRQPIEMAFDPGLGHGVLLEDRIYAGFRWPLAFYGWGNGHCFGPNVDVRDGRTGFLGEYASSQRIYFNGPRVDGETNLFFYSLAGLDGRRCADWSFAFVEDSSRFAVLVREPDSAEPDALQIAFGDDPELPSSILLEIPVELVTLESTSGAPARRYDHLGLASNGSVLAARVWDSVSAELRFFVLDRAGAIMSQARRPLTPRRVTPWRLSGSDFELVSEDDGGRLHHFVLRPDGTLADTPINVPAAERSALHFGVSPGGQRAVAVARRAGAGDVAELMLFTQPGAVTTVTPDP